MHDQLLRAKQTGGVLLERQI